MGIPVFLSSDNNYAPFVATTIASILDHTKAEVNFYVLDGGITAHNKRKINTLVDQFSNFSIEYLHVDVKKYFGDFPNLLWYGLGTYSRYLIALFKPDLQKAIYADVDVIFRGDIQELYDIDMEGYALAASAGVTDLRGHEVNHIQMMKNLGLKNTHRYFNSGILLLDLNLWRLWEIPKKLMALTQKHKDKLRYPDQDISNIFFENNYKEIPCKYNLETWVIPSQKPKNSAWQEAIDRPCVIHYASAFKPWKDRGVPYEWEFWKYAKRTAFYEEILLRFLQAQLREKQ